MRIRSRGFGGLPLGTNGKGMVLLSGGIDSPVAAWMITAKRGMVIRPFIFRSYPYTSERAQEKVFDLTRILASYCGRIKVHCVNLLGIQEAIGENCPEDEMTILSRRFMMMIAGASHEIMAAICSSPGKISVRWPSQTAQGLVVTVHAVSLCRSCVR